MHERLEALLARLDDPSTRGLAAEFLHEVATHIGHRKTEQKRLPLTVTDLALPEQSLRLLQLPSVFAPEQWSFTFYEGLRRMPRSEFEGRAVTEVGCGNGWISLALARFGQPRKVVGLDINPRAVLSARLNAYLNATGPDGSLLLDGSGRSLLDRVEFHVSDVLTWCRERRLLLDRVIGCIPQVLDPQLELSDAHALSSRSDSFLYALSNYCGREGFVEDQFGLGLMARVLEESIEVLGPGGKVVFNMGGRPGRALLRSLFERRGYAVSEIWRTRAQQAEDTEIDALLEIETRTDHRFEFFLSRHGDEPVSARTAAAVAHAGGPIFHSIDVYQGELPYAPEVKRIFAVLRDSVFRSAHDSVDLAFGSPALAEEKLRFLADVSDWLARPLSFPYGETAGLHDLRAHVSRFLATYFGAPLAPDSVVALPTRAAAIVALLLCHRPQRALIDTELVRQLFGDTPPRPRWGETELLEAPRSLESCRELLCRLRPELLVISLASPESQSLHAVRALVEVAKETGTTLVLDVSAGFELSSAPAQGSALRLAAEEPLPDHVTLLCGLVKDDVYRDLELSLLLTENATVLQVLHDVAELTYSRSPLLVQKYYSTILSDLVSFRMPQQEPPSRQPRRPATAPATAPGVDHEALGPGSRPLPPGTLRLDYGENTLPAPTCLRAYLLEAFARRELGSTEVNVQPELAALLQTRWGLAQVAPERLHLGCGVAPLFSALMHKCAADRGRLFLPSGAYGYFAGAAALMGVPVEPLETRRDASFRLTPELLQGALSRARGPAWVYLNAPVVNPTGALYRAAEFEELLEVVRDARATLVLDTVFAGLQHGSLHGAEAPLASAAAWAGVEFVLLGGISKEFAAGGLRFGFGYASTPSLSRALASSAVFGVPHATLRFAVKRLLAESLRDDSVTREELVAQRRLLADRAHRLCAVLRASGWDPIEPEGGLFVLARPSDRLVSAATNAAASIPGPGDAVVRALLHGERLLVNGPAFTGIPGHYRFVLSVEEDVFEKALTALRSFHARLGAVDDTPPLG